MGSPATVLGALRGQIESSRQDHLPTALSRGRCTWSQDLARVFADRAALVAWLPGLAPGVLWLGAHL